MNAKPRQVVSLKINAELLKRVRKEAKTRKFSLSEVVENQLTDWIDWLEMKSIMERAKNA